MKTEYLIPACSGKKIDVLAGQTITVTDVDGGQVVEQGTHDSLMAQNGFYRQLYEAQFDSVA